ncbi:MAG: pseudouridylate synthase [Bacteroidales bacterium]|nr:pseudouridylate synthase [Bacteroidales bacterium]
MDYKLPSKEFLRTIDIHKLLPQQEPFVMTGTLIHFEMNKLVTEFVIPEDNLFVNDGKFSEAGLIENMAQTCAARIGYINKYILLRGIQIGYIGAIRNLEIKELPSVGDLITTEVNIQEEVFGMLLADANVKCGDKVIASTEMKIAVRDEEVNV